MERPWLLRRLLALLMDSAALLTNVLNKDQEKVAGLLPREEIPNSFHFMFLAPMAVLYLFALAATTPLWFCHLKFAVAPLPSLALIPLAAPSSVVPPTKNYV
jgi:hypothetical protein